MPRRSADAFVTGHSWFLGIGIDAYTEFTPLRNAVKDMLDVQNVLTEYYDITSDHSSVLTNAQATEENILLEFERLAAEVGEHDKLLIYYSGHGYLNDSTDLAYWIPVDARHGRSSDYIPNSTIRDHLSAIDARHILLISDSCFSGSLFIKGGTRSTRATEELARTPSRWALCSGRGNEEVEDGIPGQNSPFAQSVLEALRDNTSDLWNVSKLVERVREQTAATANQLPEGNPLRLPGHKGGQYVFQKAGHTVSTASNQTHSREQTRQEPLRSSVATSKHATKSGPSQIVKVAIPALLIIIAIVAWIFLKPEKDIASVSVATFHTTSSVNENVWPADQNKRFNTGDRVYIYGLVIADMDTRVRIRWLDSNNSLLDNERKEVIASTVDPFRLSSYKIFKDPGLYFVEIQNNNSQTIARDTFSVRKNQ